MSPDRNTSNGHEVWRRHYTREELAGALAKARRLLACEALALTFDNDVSDMVAISVRVGRELIRLTCFMSSKETYVALTSLSLVPTLWDYDRQHQDSLVREAQRPRRGFGRRGVNP
jgi:hypothetical protein